MLARRDDADISRYFKESQRSQRAKGPAILAANICYSPLAYFFWEEPCQYGLIRRRREERHRNEDETTP